MTSQRVSQRRLLTASRRFLTSASCASSEAVATYCRNVEFALKHMELDPSLSCTPEYDELVGVLGDLHGLCPPQFRHENQIFPPPDVLRRRRVQAVERAAEPPTKSHVDSILSQLEEHVQSGWDAQNVSLMDDTNDLIEDLDDLLGATPHMPEQPTASLKDMREKLGIAGTRGVRASASAEQSKEEKDAMEAEMYQMTQHLKAYAHSYDESLQDDAALINSVADRAQANLAKLDSENARLEVHLNNGLTMWKMLLLLALVFVVFLGMYIFMKLFAHRRYPLF
ncbi:hypothetical protein SDRG_01738 [Saprolegnia diclina VS20]|uniref:Vesicle transport protein USE1 n=1 Tax=Saprolegnia diclina (strain VS20) TaxID=1156394 RepID=T0R2V7_SAPDV|nr:hypothetical protein SDRG_01738 [Saprolegnia diclina VS20]EQC40660.1 hypothetical protein SDRG_01738 [Saprolegnia diclina VS20]|eukprot:XP_008605504.1 hypothetical protein SDRG_01738 [Saprolegnia diclina VS20]